MNKKQGIIIVSLLVLIVIAGVLATRVQGPLYFPTDETASSEDVEKSSESGDEYFSQAKLNKTSQSEDTLKNLRTIIEDESLPEDSRREAKDQYVSVNLNAQNETKIEEDLKGKGFEDAVVTIGNDKASVIVKSDKELTDEQTRMIQKSIITIANIKDFEITYKQ
ncbi:putative stage III sporulation protein [Clostridium bornimense]|uniref:Putative stage III sporulation protein n=1 Tax=Clostridium bornimense TaxID=1216932 RepID=W6RVA8_9CLOT|nr:SpoIIIAH-like family protein [Clostridium bornimense]CDM68616.1 putative stage III sporulation protein [Clostridium bornimense]